MSSLGLETGSSTGRGEEGEGGHRQIWNSFVIFRFLLYSRGVGGGSEVQHESEKVKFQKRDREQVWCPRLDLDP